MMKMLLSILAILVTTSTAVAQCVGTDLRPTLTSAERTTLDRTIAATPFAQGNHWRAQKGDTTLHIIGTVHMHDARLGPIADRLAPLFDVADRIWLEATPKEEAQLQTAVLSKPELLFLTQGPTLPELLPEDAWQDLADAARDRGIPAFMAAKFQPWYLSVLLSLPACAVAEMANGPKGFDAMLGNMADAANIPQQALEPFDTLFQLMGQEPMDEQLEFLRLGVLPNSVAENSFATLLASYFDENTVEVLEMARIVAKRHVDLPARDLDAVFDDMLASLLDVRNRAWVDTLANAPAGVSLVAVGAGHLPGKFGVLKLLQDRGFKLARQPF